jgi:diguanylate cyclase (GGDEF)-like protein
MSQIQSKHTNDQMLTKSIPRRHGYLSLKTVFFMAFGLVLFLCASIAAVAYYRLVDFQSLLNTTTMKSLPKVMTYAKMYSQVNELTYATENLTNVNTQGQRRIAFALLDDKIEDIPLLIRTLGDDERLIGQLSIIKQEVSGLNDLIETRLNTKNLLDEQRLTIYQTYEIAISDNNLSSSVFAQATSALIILAEQALVFKKLNKIKQHSRAIDDIHLKASTNSSLTDTQRDLLHQLRKDLVGESGLLPLRIQQLKIFGRTRGRADFVRNLVIDYARLAEYESFRYNKSVVKNTATFSARVKEQTRALRLTAIFVILVLIIITFFIQRRLIRRLVLLNTNVISRLAGAHIDLRVGGNDEITDIARSFNQFAETIEIQKKELIRKALTDGLTNIANRRGLDKEFKHLMLVAQRQKWPVAILMMDVDNFKGYNDFYGHVAGDDCLQKIAAVLEKVLRRPEDFVARYGGEEFVCLLPNTPIKGAEKVAQSILDAIQEANIPHQKSNVAPYVTLSLGISIYESGKDETSDTLLKLADTALYKAKANGKNCFSS